MSDSHYSERTEPPSQRRRDAARAAGREPRNRDLAAALSLLVVFTALPWWAPWLASEAMSAVRSMLERVASAPDLVQPGEINGVLAGAGGSLLAAMLPAMLCGSIATIAAFGLQTRGFFSLGLLCPDLGRLNPVHGWRRVASTRSVVNACSAFTKISLIVLFLLFTWRSLLETALFGGELPTIAVLRSAWDQCWRDIVGCGVRIALALIAIGVFDYYVDRWLYERSLRMTRREVQEELASDEGKGNFRTRRQQQPPGKEK